VAIAFSAFFGFLAIRAKGVYFLMITLSLAMVIWGLAYRWSAVTEGDNGINVPGRPSLLGISLENDITFFYFALVVFLICLGILYLVVQSPFGRTLVGIREREERMEMLGYNIWLHKYLAFIIAGTFGGVAGVMWTLFNLFVSPPDVELITSAEALFMVALGGSATLIGPVIGAAIIRTLQQFVSIYVERWPLILGSIYIMTIMLSRLYGVNGILGLANKLRSSTAAASSPQD
jgi:branched-chain amino acid transport system permease protein